MSLFELEAESRTDTGKGASRRLRHAGKIPAIVYGGDKEPQSVTLKHSEVLKRLDHEAFYSHILTLNVDGKPNKTILRDMQRHPSKALIMHMDFFRVDENQAIRVQAPLHFVGDDVSPGVKAGGLVTHELTDVAIETLPKNLPEFIEVDISGLDIGDSVHLSDLTMPEGVTLVELSRGEGHDQAVVSIHAKRGGDEDIEDAAAEGDTDAAATEGDSED